MLFLLFPSVGSRHVPRPLQLCRSRPVLPVACWATTLLLVTGCGAIPNPWGSSESSPSPGVPAAPTSSPAAVKAVSAKTGASKTAAKTTASKPTANQAQAIQLNDRGVGKIGQADYKGALQDFTQALKLDPKLSTAYLGRGIAYSGLGNSQAALKDYNQAIKLKASFAPAYLNRADEYATLGQNSQAMADLQKASQLFAKQGDAENAKLAKSRIDDLKNPIAAPAVVTQVADSSTAPSSADAFPLALARHLKRIGARMYSAYWCPACQRQREEFGETAFQQVTEIECDPRGNNAQPALCAQANVQAYPTWEIKGQVYRGGMSLEELASISGYKP